MLISLALCSDALIGNFQEKVLKQYAASNSEMVCVLVYVPLSYLNNPNYYFNDSFRFRCFTRTELGFSLSWHLSLLLDNFLKPSIFALM